MAKKTVIQKTTRTGTKTVEKDTAKKTGRQKTKSDLGKNKTQAAIAGETLATAGGAIASRHNADVEKERDRQKTYRAAIEKWNGILKSTPQAAEGSNDPMEGSISGQPSESQETNTGTTPPQHWGW